MSHVCNLGCSSCCYKRPSFDWEDQPIFDVPEDLLDAKVSETEVDSAHNPFIKGWQIGGSNSPVYFKETLYRKVRMGELDIWRLSAGNAAPIVTHGSTIGGWDFHVTKSWEGSQSFSDYAEVVNDYAFKSTNAPFFMVLDVNTKDTDTLTEVANTIYQQLGTHLFNSNLPLGQVQYKNLLNKVVIISSAKDCEPLADVVNYAWSNTFQNIKFSTLNDHPELPEFNRMGNVTRLYPDNKILSRNPSDIEKGWDNGCTFVTVNDQHHDEGWRKNREHFIDYPIKRKAMI